MTLAPGVRLGPYTILAALGAGGMGEVYRAHDSRLGRDVAIKVLPAAFSEDPDRLRRFEQEARATAALNHPNILAVHDIGIEGNAPFIVSELLEGQTLREQLRGVTPIPVRTAVGYAIAIARGLAAAHEKGVVHRDLKPDNLFITADGRVKILDFGLAKLLADGTGDHSALPTESPHTAIGLVLGTVGYMSPEQVRGLAVDHRTDVFAFGAIVYEVLSGSRAFDRQTAPETLTAILNDHPHDLGSNHRAIPPALVHIVERCLEKKPSARFQTASDLAFALETLSDTTRSPTPPHAPDTASPARRGAWIGWAVAALLLATLAPVAYQHVVEQPVAVDPIRFRIPPAVELAGPGNFSISPDGRHLAFFGLGSDGTARLWVRDMQSLDARFVAGSDVFGPAPPPFWSPDSRFIAFDAGGKLKKVEASGGPAQTLCDLPGVGVGGTWNRNGEILVGNTEGGVLRVRETGGAAVPVTTLDADRKEEFHLIPTFLPDGRHFVYLRISPSAPDLGGTYVGSIDAKPDEQSTERLMPYAVGLTYAASKVSGIGLLLYVREGTLVGQPFDPDRLAIVGSATPIAERIGTFRDGGFFATSANDVLVYRTADTDSQVSWFDRQGVAAGRGSDPGGFRGARLSPDGTRAIASRTDPQDPSRADLWLLDLARGGALRFTSGRGVAESPVWSPDGTRVAFTADKNSIHEKRASGEGDERELLRSTSAGLATPTGWSPDGRFLMYFVADPNSKMDLWVSASDGRKPVPFIRSEFVEDQGAFSPDGRWVAYISNQSGAYEVYVRGFTSDFSGGSAGVGSSTPISRRGGTSPRWRRDGRELFYLAADGKMMAVDVKPGPEFQAGTPAPLFQTAPGTVVGDVSADGRRFLLVNPVGPSASAPFTVVLNWTTGLKH